MLDLVDLRGVAGDLGGRLPRPRAGAEPPVAAVRAIVDEVRVGGDAAVRALTARFDGVTVDEVRVPAAELDSALRRAPDELREALEAARANILAFHEGQRHGDRHHQRDGISVREVYRPVDRAGTYVPGGEAPLASTVLMTAIPARVAGVPRVVLCSPPGPHGEVATGVLAAAAVAGVDEVYRIGGAQAIAALAYGTESLSPVDVVVGPGNMYVAQAQREVAARGVVGVPSSFAGPSEVVVVADESAPPRCAAADLVVQVEHGPDSVAWLVTWSEDVARRVLEAVGELVAAAPRREVISANLDANSHVALVDGPEQALAVANAIAPEHLQLMTSDPEALVGGVRHAGAVFCGPYSPASVGDYLAGPSHVLPTFGSARFASALGVADFQTRSHVITLDRATLARLATHVAALAEAEGMAAHAASVRLPERS
ncbi:MAG: histidinol dehydrogenase [Acidimicrobiales bacterium]